MAVSLKKGQEVELRTNTGEGLNRVMIGLGWDPIKQPKKGGLFGFLAEKIPEIDCDASVLVCNKEGKLESKADVIYYHNLVHSSGAIRHMGDNKTGNGEGDDEQVMVNLDDVPENYHKLVFIVSIYQSVQREQHFGMIHNAFIRIFERDNETEICRFDLTDNYEDMTAMIFGELNRYEDGWKFNAIGKGTKDSSLAEIVRRFS